MSEILWGIVLDDIQDCVVCSWETHWGVKFEPRDQTHAVCAVCQDRLRKVVADVRGGYSTT